MAQYLKPELRNRILDVSKHLFSQNGYTNTLMRDIAKEAKVTVGNLYRYFKSKEDIYNALLAPVSAKIKEFLQQNTGHYAAQADVSSLKLKNYLQILDLRKTLEPLINDFCYFLNKLYLEFPSETIMLIDDLQNYRYEGKEISLGDWIVDLISFKLKLQRKVSELNVSETKLCGILKDVFFDGIEKVVKGQDDGTNFEFELKEFIMMYIKMIE